MADWITYPLALTGQTVALHSLDEHHFVELEMLAKDKRIWEFYVYDGSDSKTFLNVMNAAIVEREKGNQFPFVIFHQQDKKIIGSTRFLDIQFQHKKLEIGSTWLHPDYWATEVNLECKLLLLEYCFEKLHAVRVQLKTDERNIRSRKAIEKIGGQFEGILRNDMIRDNHTHRNSAYYSIIETEWSALKTRLAALYETKRNRKMEIKAIGQEMDKSDMIYNSEDCQAVLKIYETYYPENGFSMPWVGYFVIRDNQIVGCCGFTGQPKDGKVEIAYWTFKAYEGKGIASFACKALIDITQQTVPGVIITAKTAPEHNASTKILQRNGFIFTEIVQDHEIGDAWLWVYQEEA